MRHELPPAGLGSLPEQGSEPLVENGRGRTAVAASGFSLHAGVAAQGSQREKIERLARYMSRPPIATERPSLTEIGHVRYALKTPYRGRAPPQCDRSI